MDHVAACVRLCDFDMSKYADDEAVHGGTPGYLAPELYAALHGAFGWGDEVLAKLAAHGIAPGQAPPYSAAVDNYAMGVMLYRLLGGADGPVQTLNIFDYEDYEEQEQAELLALLEPPQFGAAFSSISAAAKGLITALMAPDPAKRLTAAQALEHDWLRPEEVMPAPSASAPPLRIFSAPRNASAPTRQTSVQLTESRFFKQIESRLRPVLNGEVASVRLPRWLHPGQRYQVHCYCEDRGLQSCSEDTAEGRVLTVRRPAAPMPEKQEDAQGADGA